MISNYSQLRFELGGDPDKRTFRDTEGGIDVTFEPKIKQEFQFKGAVRVSFDPHNNPIIRTMFVQRSSHPFFEKGAGDYVAVGKLNENPLMLPPYHYAAHLAITDILQDTLGGIFNVNMNLMETDLFQLLTMGHNDRMYAIKDWITAVVERPGVTVAGMIEGEHYESGASLIFPFAMEQFDNAVAGEEDAITEWILEFRGRE